MYNPMSDSGDQRERIAAYFAVIQDLAQQEETEMALMLFNDRLRHMCIPGSMETVWQLALASCLSNCRCGKEESLPNMAQLKVACEIEEMSICREEPA